MAVGRVSDPPWFGNQPTRKADGPFRDGFVEQTKKFVLRLHRHRRSHFLGSARNRAAPSSCSGKYRSNRRSRRSLFDAVDLPGRQPTLRGRPHYPQARSLREFLLPLVETHEPPQAKFQRAGDVENVERARAESAGMLTRQFSRPFQCRTPKQICRSIPTGLEILIQRSEGRAVDRIRNESPMCGERQAVDEFDAPVQRDGKRPGLFRAPRGHGARLRLVKIELQERARIGVELVSVRHDSRRATPGLELPSMAWADNS